MRFVVFGILDMRWKYRKMVKPQERLFMQSKRLHKESFLWNDLFHDKNKSEPIANRRKVRIYSLWWSIWDSNPRPPHCQCDALPTALMPQEIFMLLIEYHMSFRKAILSYIYTGKSILRHVDRFVLHRNPMPRWWSQK